MKTFFLLLKTNSSIKLTRGKCLPFLHIFFTKAPYDSKPSENFVKRDGTEWKENINFLSIRWPELAWFFVDIFSFCFLYKLIQTKSFPLFFHSGYKWFARRNCRNLWKFIWKSRMNSNFIQTLWYYKSSKHWKRNFQTMFVILYKPDGSALE